MYYRIFYTYKNDKSKQTHSDIFFCACGDVIFRYKMVRPIEHIKNIDVLSAEPINEYKRKI